MQILWQSPMKTANRWSPSMQRLPKGGLVWPPMETAPTNKTPAGKFCMDRHGLLKNVQLLSSVYNKRRNFRSQTSHSMDRWKADVVRVKEEKRREEKRRRRSKKRKSQKRESLRRKKIQKKEDPGARKGSKAVAKHCVFQMIYGSGGSKSRLAKSAGAEPAGQMRYENCTPLWREAHFEVKMHKAHQVRTTLGTKNDGMRATFEEDLQRCIFRGRRSTRDMFIRAVRRSGRWFPENGCILEPQIFRFAEMILRDRSSTSYDLASLFRGRRSS